MKTKVLSIFIICTLISFIWSAGKAGTLTNDDYMNITESIIGKFNNYLIENNYKYKIGGINRANCWHIHNEELNEDIVKIGGGYEDVTVEMLKNGRIVRFFSHKGMDELRSGGQHGNNIPSPEWSAEEAIDHSKYFIINIFGKYPDDAKIYRAKYTYNHLGKNGFIDGMWNVVFKGPDVVGKNRIQEYIVVTISEKYGVIALYLYGFNDKI